MPASVKIIATGTTNGFKGERMSATTGE